MATKPNYILPKFDGWNPTITYLPSGMGIAEATITPEVAALMLATNRDDNRNKRRGAIGRYADDMANTRWKRTHQGIAFDIFGKLCDGQHRLSGCVESGASFPTLVFFGVGSSAEMAALDTGANRTASDASKYLVGERIGHHLFASLRMFLVGPTGSRLNATHLWLLEKLDVYKGFGEFHEAANFGRNVPGPVRAAVMRAYYYADRADLIRFTGIVADRIDPSEPRDKSAKMLRKILDSSFSLGGQSAQSELYRKAQRAIHAYINGETLDKLYATTDDLFPLPTEEQIAERGELEAKLTAAQEAK